MFRKPIVHLVIGALLVMLIGARPIAAQSKELTAAEFTASVKKKIVKLGTGPEAKLQVKLQDKTKLKGYVSKVGEESFALRNPKTNTETTVLYPNVTQLKTKMSTGEVITISALAAVGGIILLAVIVGHYRGDY